MAAAGAARAKDAGGSRLRPGPASIRDVARLARVSPQTVSRVLNGHPNVSAPTGARVRAAMGELRFRPSRAARALSAGRSRTIGVLAEAGAYYGQTRFVSAVEDAAGDRGYCTAVVRLAADGPAALQAAIEDLAGHDVEGVLVLASPPGAVARLAQQLCGVPVVAAHGDRPEEAGTAASPGQDPGAG